MRPGRGHIFWLAPLLCLALLSCGRENDPAWQGYVEGEFVYLAAQLTGRLDELPARRGERVLAGQKLFTLEHVFELEAVAKAEAGLAKSQHTLDDLRKGLRPEEMRQLEAKLARSESLASLDKLEFERRKALLKQGAVAVEEYNQIETALQAELANQRDFQAQIATGKLGSRLDQILAAKAQVEQSRLELEQARWSLEQKTVAAPMDALVFDLLHYQGELVAANSPVLTLLPPQNLKIRFFVPEKTAGGLKIGQEVRVFCDGCPEPYSAKLSFISPQVEYTPPVIFSQGFREKLVIMVEARPSPEIAAGLNPGQPVDVRLNGAK